MRLKTDEFDPLQYIESAFLDTQPAAKKTEVKEDEVQIPSLSDYIAIGGGKEKEAPLGLDREEPKVDEPKVRFRRTEMSAPRPRRAKSQKAKSKPLDPELQGIWEALPKTIDFLMSYFDDSVAAKYYGGEFDESRQELIKRILDPQLTLEETSRLLGVCPATVRRYTNRGWLKHHRTEGGQRRFRLSDVGRFVEEHGRFPEE